MSMFKKGLLYLCAVFWFLLFIVAIIIKRNEYSLEDSVAMAFIGILPFLIITANIVVKARQRTKLAKQLTVRVEKENEKINNLQSGLPVLNVPDLFFDNALLHFFGPAVLLNTVNKMTGLINETTGISRQYYSGINLFNNDFEQYKTRSTGRSNAIYNNVTNRYFGQLAITSKSILFINIQKGFEIKINDIAFVQMFSDGISIQSGDNVYTVLLSEPRYLLAVLNLVRNKSTT